MMKDKMLELETLHQFNNYLENKTLHPMVSAVDLSKSNLTDHSIKFDFYTILLIEGECTDFMYGRKYYDYSNAIVDRLEKPHQYEHLTNAAQPQSSTQFTPQQQPLPSQETQPIHRMEQYLESSSSIGGSIGSLFDIPILPNGDDPEEEMFRRRMQRKKKKGRRM